LNILEIRSEIYKRIKSDKKSSPVVPVRVGEKTIRELIGLKDTDDNIFHTRIFPAQPIEEPKNFPILVCYRDKTNYHELSKRFFVYNFCISIYGNDPTMETNDMLEKRLFDIFHLESFDGENEKYESVFVDSEEFNELDNGIYCTVITIAVISKEAMDNNL
jgi:hypothetical protein